MIKIVNEKYVSKYDFLNNEDDDDDNVTVDIPSKPIKHLSKYEINRIVGIFKMVINKYPKLKRCCEYVELDSKNEFDDNAVYTSPFDRYYAGPTNRYFKLIEGDVWPGYPDFNSNGSSLYYDDRHNLINEMNKSLKEKNIPAMFTYGSTSSDESISFGVKSIKTT